MIEISLIVLCAGDSTRFNNRVKKSWIAIENTPLWFYITNKISNYYNFNQVIVVGSEDEISYMKNFDNNMLFIGGGASRQESINNALAFVKSEYVLITDSARVNISKALVESLIFRMKQETDISLVAPYIEIVDTAKYNNKTISRDAIKLIQTPQLSKTSILNKALKGDSYTDESSAMESIGKRVEYVAGDKNNFKITYLDDLKRLDFKISSDIFSGNGIDIHKFQENKKMYLGGVLIESDFGFKAHSDGDVLIHSLIDSILGAIGAGDIGDWFPDSDDRYKGIDSKIMLSRIVEFYQKIGFEIINVDISIVAQKPRLEQYKKKIKQSIADLLHIENRFVNIKATTSEKLGFIGREQGACVISSVNLKYYDWDKK
jgi:2-C-methyl-D-erythritol 4-phosphate cytidylyltransferase/2-C-methyl-D-erythritol 2,4-cyclodiphosphate synthase